MKVCIAGKITGDPNYKTKFAEAETVLKAEGNVVLNPAVLPEGMRPGDYMRICLAMLDVADYVYFLSDYGQSRGCGVEYSYCQYASKQTMYQQPQ